MLVGANKAKIIKAYKNSTDSKVLDFDLDLYGSGKASGRII
jgi:hypothetical protein